MRDVALVFVPLLLLAACDDVTEVLDAAPATIPGAIRAAAGAHSDRFGSSVAISDGLVAIGSPGSDAPEPEAGSVVLLERTGINFKELTVLTRPDGEAQWGDRFGQSVALADDLLLVGAPGVDMPDRNSGAVFVFQGSGSSWTLVSTLASPAPFSDQEFGSSIVATSDLVIVGATGVDFDSRDVGAVIVYRRNGSEITLAEDVNTSR